MTYELRRLLQRGLGGGVITTKDAKAINHDAIQEKLVWLFHLRGYFLRRMLIPLRVALAIPGKIGLERYIYVDIAISISLDREL